MTSVLFKPNVKVFDIAGITAARYVIVKGRHYSRYIHCFWLRMVVTSGKSAAPLKV